MPCSLALPAPILAQAGDHGGLIGQSGLIGPATQHTWALPVVLAISVLAIFVAMALRSEVLKKDRGNEAMQAIADAIQEGAEAFMARMNKAILQIAIGVAVLIFVLYVGFRKPVSAEEIALGQTNIAIAVTISFVLGAASSAISGYLGMWIAIRTNIRTASAAIRSLNEALVTALRGGAVSGIFVVALSLLGVGLIFGILQAMDVDVKSIPYLIVGYGFGASLVALFAQLGGGIYTKAADVGADLVGKVEAGIPEDDPRNPAVIADLVGDNVGDCAGRGADLFESTAAENIGAMILGVALYPVFGFNGIVFPLVARAFGLIASIIGIYSVKLKNEDEDPMEALNRGYGLTTALGILGFAAACGLFLQNPDHPDAWFKFLFCGLIGLANSYAFVWITQYYTEYKYRPVREIAEASQTGPATNIIAGVAVGMESTGYSVIAISIAIVSSYLIGQSTGIPHAGLFGTAVATMGMLATAAYILAMDTFGPITDNAGGIVEMSQQPEEIRAKTDRLDAVGNTTKALTKGYAIGSAALAAFLLFSAYLEEVTNSMRNAFMAEKSITNIMDPAVQAVGLHTVNLADPLVFTGGLLGACLVFVFSSLTIRAVGKAAYSVIQAVREQFKNKPGIMLGTEKPDYAQCVDIVTKGALEQMRIPGLMVVFAPIVVGVLFKSFATKEHQVGAETVAGMLMVATIAGILMAMLLNNSGGAWDNAKKYIETGAYGGKKSEPHKAAVVGDTVGDPFKDTAGPSLHVLVKLLATITLVMAPFFLK